MKCFASSVNRRPGAQAAPAGQASAARPAAVANAQDDLTRALIGLSLDLAGQTPSDEQRRVMLEGLFTTVTNVSFDGVSVATLTSRVNALRTGASGTDCAASGEPLAAVDGG